MDVVLLSRLQFALTIMFHYLFPPLTIGITLLFGVAVGNALRGVQVDEFGDMPGALFTQLHPYCLLVGLLAVAMFAMHGASDNDAAARLRASPGK